jgi:L-asparaginase / beta-aspartyl-peptidase
MRESWSIIVHGGAGKVRAGREQRKRDGCLRAVAAGQDVLERGGSAVEAVEAAIRVMEEDAVFNAGYGSVLNADGEVEVDAAIMDGATLDAGAVCALQGVRNPITVARAMLAEAPVLLAGAGARRFAERHGGILCDPRELIASEKPDETHDTVGAVAYDRQGNIAAGESTGGMAGTMPGRVGDAPIIGAGLYAENEVAGCAFSGDGESVLRLGLATRLICDMAEQDAPDAARRAIRLMDRVGGEAGVIVLGPAGEPAFAHNSPNFAVALASSSRPAQAFLARHEWSEG